MFGQNFPRTINSGRLIVAIGAILLLGMSLLLTPTFWRGFDFTDESHYVLHFSGWRDYFGKVTYFGALLGPIFELFGKDLAQFRAFGYFSLVVVLLWCANVCCRYLSATEQFGGSIGISLLLAPLAATYYLLAATLATPSYNWLNLWLMLFLSGLVCLISFKPGGSNSSRSLMYVAYSAAIGFAFFNKFSSAATLLIVHICFSLLCAPTLRDGFRVAITLAGCFVFSVGALSIWLSNLLGVSVLTEFGAGIELARLLVPTDPLVVWHRFWREDLFQLFAANVTAKWLYVIGGMWFVAIVLCLVRVRPGAIRVAGVLAWISYMASLYAAWSIGIKEGLANHFFLSLTGLTLFVVARAFRADEVYFSEKSEIRRILSIAMLGFTMPVCFAVGSSNQMHYMAGLGSALIAVPCAVVGLFVVRSSLSKAAYVMACASTALALASGLNARWVSPEATYRLATGLREQNVPVLVSGGELMLDQKTSRFVQSTRQVFSENGLKARSPFVDLSGLMPGLAVILDVKPIGAAWMLGGYDQSNQYVRKVLSHVTENELRCAWLAVSDGPASKIDWYNVITSRLGGEFPYSPMGDAVSPNGTKLRFYKPSAPCSTALNPIVR
jgi:hypothetical protein